MSGMGWTALLVSLNNTREWSIAFDITSKFRSTTFMRLAHLGNYLFLGDEKDTGTLLRIKLSSLKHETITLQKSLKSYVAAIHYALHMKILGHD